MAILFIAAVAVLITIRSRFVPETFGDLGHYRAASIETIAAQDIQYAGWQVCVGCHDDQGEAKSRSYHRSLSCEVCHGPANGHANDPDTYQPRVPRQRGEVCLYCHEYLPSRPTGFPQIVERVHNAMEPCITCHEPHDPTPPETPETCAACHAQIARMKAVSHHYTVDCQTCHETEPEHRVNPRAYQPKKPTARESCGQCHAPGANSPSSIPRIDPQAHGDTYLCWQCHYPHFPGS